MTHDQIEARLIQIVALNYGRVVDGGDPLMETLELDSLEFAGFVLDIEGEWPQIEGKIDLDSDLLRKGTTHEIAGAIHRIVANSP